MKSFEVLLVGGCMIPGVNLAPIYSLPVLIDRGFRNSNVRINITADAKNSTFEQSYISLKSLLMKKSYDIVIIQFLHGSIFPQIGLKSKLQRYFLSSIIYNLLHNIEIKLITPKWRTYFRNEILRLKLDNSYQMYLKQCIKTIKRSIPNCFIFLLTPIAPTANSLFPNRHNFIEGRNVVIQLSQEEKIKVIDIWEKLENNKPEEVYIQEDGFHLTAAGQKIVAKAIIDSLKTVITPEDIHHPQLAQDL